MDRRTPQRVLVAGLFHETHTFLSDSTSRDDFQWASDEALLAIAGDASPLGGVLAYAQQRHWQVLPGVWATAVPGGTVDDEVWQRYWRQLQAAIFGHLSGGIDAVYLVLHGAMVCHRCRDVEGELLRHLRAIPALMRVPIYGVIDLHANVSPAMVSLSDCLVAYRENPHTDARASAWRAAKLLDQRLAGGAPLAQQLCQLPILWAPPGTGSADDPMRALLDRAAWLEQQAAAIRCINIVPGFAFADTRDTGLAITVVSEPAQAADAALEELQRLARQLAPLGVITEPDADGVLSDWHRRQPPGLTVIAEPSDNIGGGAPGDGTGLLRAFLRHGIQRAAVCLNDPEAVAALERCQPGQRVSLAIGGRGSPLDPGPVQAEWTLAGLHDGRFELVDKQSHLASLAGDQFEMGRCAVVTLHGVTVLLTSRRTPPMDLGQWYAVGIDPATLSLVGVKAAVAHRRAYNPIASEQLAVSTPGPCTSDLSQFDYRQLRRPIYPLDAGALEAEGGPAARATGRRIECR